MAVALNDVRMRELGFTDYNKEHWFKGFRLVNNIFAEVTIIKTSGTWDATVIDDVFGQPYHYGWYKVEIQPFIIGMVDEINEWLESVGLEARFSHWEHGLKLGYKSHLLDICFENVHDRAAWLGEQLEGLKGIPGERHNRKRLKKELSRANSYLDDIRRFRKSLEVGK